jgi:hypothetical protein
MKQGEADKKRQFHSSRCTFPECSGFQLLQSGILFKNLPGHFECNRDFFANCTGHGAINRREQRSIYCVPLSGLKEAKNAEAYRAIAAGCVPNGDFSKGR